MGVPGEPQVEGVWLPVFVKVGSSGSPWRWTQVMRVRQQKVDLWGLMLVEEGQKIPGRSRGVDNGDDAGKHLWVALQTLQCRSEEHTSELQSLMRISYAVFCLNKKNYTPSQRTT